MQIVEATLQYTNESLSTRRHRTIKAGDWFKWFGLRLAMALEPSPGPVRVYWETEARDGFMGTPPCFGQRFGMSRQCFEQIMNCMSFSDGYLSDDPWKPIRLVVDGFNARRKNFVSPGNLLCVDECVSAWKGREVKYCHDEGKGTELKSIADGESGVLLGLELVEGKDRQRAKQYYREYGEGTAVVLRLAAPYKGVDVP
ncbi:hypothetical protein PHMEG_00041199 [Phytophthora megakarya]|uniref:PiggyBac transposable element-derived protein domain-containing protein n=1 Tax=Phytophthora megakarya TaxID=4795 RepID=A0A225UC39_9STRA|nr:hypothetical protein PHMEG_00041199 [Phytophthora megakarya]